jgi:N-acetylmuramoyl-L-alanine amidase
MSESAQERLTGRRRLIKLTGASLLLTVSPLSRAAPARNAGVLAVRIWPAADYTRVAIEHAAPLKYTHFLVRNPERLVVDLEGIELNNVLESLANKVAPDDPNIRLLRAGRYKPGVVRLVMELKGEVNPQVFELPPVGTYGHRLVLDVYPLNPPDPLLSLLDNKEPLAGGGREQTDQQVREPSAGESGDQARAEIRTGRRAEAGCQAAGQASSRSPGDHHARPRAWR